MINHTYTSFRIASSLLKYACERTHTYHICCCYWCYGTPQPSSVNSSECIIPNLEFESGFI
nr:MAG TPA: hypothetical protein [Bacteriophage sp.]